jgi:hypothetical protein
MGVRTLIGTYDGTSHAAAMVDSVSGQMFGQIFEGPDAEDQVEAFLEWMRIYKFVSLSEAIGLDTSDVPPPQYDLPTDPRVWPDAGLAKLIRYWKAEHVDEETRTLIEPPVMPA